MEVKNGNRALAFIRRTLGIDRAIAFTVLARSWASAAGLITVALIAHFMSPVEQGYYYTFASLLALQFIFEMGFSTAILQMASHESAHLSINDDGSIVGHASTHGRLASLLKKSLRWYTISALLLFVVLVPAGIIFFSTHQHAGQQVGWMAPWCCAAFATIFTFQIDPIFSFLEGCGYVPNVASTRLLQAVFGSSFAWIALFSHHGLYAPAANILGQAVAGSSLLYKRRRLILGLLRHAHGHHNIGWREEIWPFQWRLAVSWIAGYFTFQLFNPILFAYRGPIEAGQMGMSLSICTALFTVCLSWVATKQAPFGMLIARKEFAKLDQVFFRALRQAVGLMVLGGGAILGTLIYMNIHRIHYGQRVIAPVAFGLLLISMTNRMIVTSEAIYLRAHKQEKFMINSVVGGIYMSLAAFFLGRAYGPMGIVVGTIFGSVVIGLGFGTYTFRKYRRMWHQA